MLTLSTHLDLQVPMHRVWLALIDFPNYRKWHPFIKLAGRALEGETVDFTFRRHPNAEGGMTAKATIVRLQAEDVFAFSYGIPFLLFAEDRYSLVSMGGKTRLTRTAQYRGVVPFVSGWAAKKRMTSLLELPVHSLARYLEGTKVSSSGNRLQSRQRRRKTRRRTR